MEFLYLKNENIKEFETEVNDILYVLDWSNYKVEYFKKETLNGQHIANILIIKRSLSSNDGLFRQIQIDQMKKENPEVIEKCKKIMANYKQKYGKGET